MCFACATVVAVSYETVMGGFTVRERERERERERDGKSVH